MSYHTWFSARKDCVPTRKRIASVSAARGANARAYTVIISSLAINTCTGGATNNDAPPGHDIGHWPAGPTAIFSRRASRATSMHFLLARWATRQQIGPPVGLEDTGPTPLVALFAKPKQTTDSHQCINGYLSPWGCSAWLCLALSLMTQLAAQSIGRVSLVASFSF